MTDYANRLRSALSKQHQQWFDYESRTMKSEYAEYIDCPACGSIHSSPYMEKDFFSFSRCGDCSMVYLNPRLNIEATYAFYNGEWTAIYNENKFIGASESTQLDDRINQENIKLLERHSKKDVERGGIPKLLEIGIGSAYFLRAAVNSGFDVYGVDVDSSNIERAKVYFGDHVKNCDLYEADFQNSMFNVVYMRDVFEHVPNPGPMLKEINRISCSNALLYIEVPNINGLIYKLVGSRHVCIFGFAHLNYWSPKSLAVALNRFGYEIVEIVHESMDCTLTDVVRYYRTSSFTGVLPQPVNRFRYIALTGLYAFLRIPPINWLDRALFPALANRLKMGSVLKVVARKILKKNDK